jgi:hypothetical protein
MSETEYESNGDYEFVNSTTEEYYRVFNSHVPKEWTNCKEKEIQEGNQGVNLFKKSFLFDVNFEDKKQMAEHSVSLVENRKVAITGIVVKRYIATGGSSISMTVIPDIKTPEKALNGSVVVNNSSTPSFVMLGRGAHFEGNHVLFRVPPNSNLSLKFPKLTVENHRVGCIKYEEDRVVTHLLPTEKDTEGELKYPMSYLFNKIYPTYAPECIKTTHAGDKYQVSSVIFDSISRQIVDRLKDSRVSVDSMKLRFDVASVTPNLGASICIDVFYSLDFDKH